MASDFSTIIGGVGQVISAAIPLLMGLAEDETSPQAAIEGVPIGPGVMLKINSTYYFANIPAEDSDTHPIHLSFTSIEDENTKTMCVDLPPGTDDMLNLNKYIFSDYPEGSCSIGGDAGASPGAEANPLMSFVQWATSKILAPGITTQIPITVDNPTTNITLNINVSGSTIALATGMVALGVTYVLVAKNANGIEGTKSGRLQQSDQSRSQDGFSYTLELPDNIDFDEGIYGYSLTVQVPLSTESRASDPAVKFDKLTPEMRSRLRVVSARERRLRQNK